MTGPDEALMIPPLVFDGDGGHQVGYAVSVEITTPEGVSHHAGIDLPADAALGDIGRALVRSINGVAATHSPMLAAIVLDQLGAARRT